MSARPRAPRGKIYVQALGLIACLGLSTALATPTTLHLPPITILDSHDGYVLVKDGVVQKPFSAQPGPDIFANVDSITCSALTNAPIECSASFDTKDLQGRAKHEVITTTLRNKHIRPQTVFRIRFSAKAFHESVELDKTQGKTEPLSPMTVRFVATFSCRDPTSTQSQTKDYQPIVLYFEKHFFPREISAPPDDGVHDDPLDSNWALIISVTVAVVAVNGCCYFSLLSEVNIPHVAERLVIEARKKINSFSPAYHAAASGKKIDDAVLTIDGAKEATSPRSLHDVTAEPQASLGDEPPCEEQPLLNDSS